MPLGVLIGMTFCDRPVQPEWAVAMMQLTLSAPMNTAIGMTSTRGPGPAESMTKICEHALDLGAAYALIVHDDTAPPLNTLRRLMEALSPHDVAVAGGIYFTKTDNPAPVVGRIRGCGPSWDWKVGDRFDCEVIGGGCMMIKTDILRLLPKPWFLIRDEQIGSILEKESEDVYFCRNVIEAGFRVVADGGVICTHWDAANNRRFEMPADAPMVSC